MISLRAAGSSGVLIRCTLQVCDAAGRSGEDGDPLTEGLQLVRLSPLKVHIFPFEIVFDCHSSERARWPAQRPENGQESPRMASNLVDQSDLGTRLIVACDLADSL